MTSQSRSQLRGQVQTVLGPVSPEAIGATLMHEHILCDITPPTLRPIRDWEPIRFENRYDVDYGRSVHAGKYKLTDRSLALDEMRRLKAEGGDTIVDLTCGGLSPDPLGLQLIATATGLNIVMGCGHYVDEFQDPANATRSVDDFAAEMIGQITQGAWGTGVKAGIIGEIGCSVPWTDLEHRTLAAAVIAQQETGAALNIHPGVAPDQPLELARFVRAAGGGLSRTIISHIDRTIFDVPRLLALADTGCVLEFDLFGFETAYWSFADIDMPNDGQRLKLILALVAAGHGDRILISQDICRLTRLTGFGGHGYGHIFRNVVPLMRARGFGDRQIDVILRGTPGRLLTLV